MTDNKQLIEMHPELLSNYDLADRTEWTLEMYETACEDVGQNKFYSQWLIGKFAFEVQEKFGKGNKHIESLDISLAKSAKIEVNSLRTYRFTYRRFREANPNFTPDGYLPFAVLQLAATTDNPVETAEILQDENIATVAGASRKIKLMKDPNAELPTKRPVIKLSWDSATKLWVLTIADEDIPKIDWKNVQTQLVNKLVGDSN